MSVFSLFSSCVIFCHSDKNVPLAVEQLIEDCVSEIGILTVL